MASGLREGEGLLRAVETATGERFPRLRGDDLLQKYSETQLVNLVKRLKQDAEDTTHHVRERRALNMAFARNQQQFGRWNVQTKTFESNVPLPKGHYDARVYLNVFLAIGRAICARFEGSKPSIQILPGSQDQSVIDKASACQKFATYLRDKLKYEEMLARIVAALVWLGNGILKIEWDPKMGKILGESNVLAFDENEQPIPMLGEDQMTGASVPLTNEDGTPRYQPQLDGDGAPIRELVYEGGIRLSFVDPDDLLYDPTVVDYDDGFYLIHSSERSPAYVYQKWGISVQPQESDRRYSRHPREKSSKPKTVCVDELWVKPGEYPFGDEPGEVAILERGYVLVVAGDRLADAGKNVYDYVDEFPWPFVKFDNIKDIRSIHAATIMDSVRVMQVAFNKAMHQILDINNKSAAHKILVNSNAPIAEKDIHNQPAVVEYTGTGNPEDKPTIFPGLAAPPGLIQAAQFILQVLQMVSGWNEGGMAGGTAGRVESGQALQGIDFKDTALLQPMANEIARGTQRVFKIALRLVKQFMPEERQFSITGDHLRTETMEFIGSDIQDTFEVRVAPESVLPMNAQAKFQRALALFSSGLIGRTDALRQMGQDDSAPLTLDSIQADRATLENLQALTPPHEITTPIEQMSLENHLVHIDEHLRCLFSERVQRNQGAWTSLLIHVNTHVLLMNQQAMMQQGMVGGGGEPPNPPSEPQAGEEPAPMQPPTPAVA